MINAKKELIEEVGEKQVELVRIVFFIPYKDTPGQIIEGDLKDVLPCLDFDYDSGYGCQYLFGYIWYTDGTWSERAEYDGSEWWNHMKRPEKDVEIEIY